MLCSVGQGGLNLRNARVCVYTCERSCVHAFVYLHVYSGNAMDDS